MESYFIEVLHYVLSFLVIISVIVFVHEFGHYFVAKVSGVRIEAFSIGFGKEIFGWTDTSGTRWKFSMVPLGGYVKMFGDEGASSKPDKEKIKKLTPEEEKVAFHTQPLGIKSLIVMAGPFANFILAVFILTFFYWQFGRPETMPVVGEVLNDSAAQEAGLQTGDTILELSGAAIERFEDIQGIAMLHPGEALSLAYEREGTKMSTTITPRLTETTDAFGNKVKMGLIGIKSGEVKYTKLPLAASFLYSARETVRICERTLVAVGQMITGRRSTEELSGILRIAQYSGQSAERGVMVVLWFMAVLSINLGLINLFPIPMLDGGHLMYYAVEALSGRPLAEKIQEFGFRLGFAFLVLLMLLATYNDLRHFGFFE